jgi:DNA (cytosine-5)-methyltransferase 1
MLNGLSLFSGIGGLDVALFEWVRPIAYCEIDPYCQGVLISRMVVGDLPKAPIWDDIKTLRLRSYDATIDILYGGFPCQDISVAGAGKGLAGERSGLFYEIIRLAKEIQPKFLFLENVPAITTRGGLQVVREIAEMGYDCRWCTISASSVGALHKRERWFLLCYANSKPSKQADQGTESKQAERKPWGRSTGQYWPFESREHWQEVVSGVCRVSDGIPFHVDRLRGLGNAVVPQQTKEAFKILMGL